MNWQIDANKVALLVVLNGTLGSKPSSRAESRVINGQFLSFKVLNFK